jgi:hypothetical protein
MKRFGGNCLNIPVGTKFALRSTDNGLLQDVAPNTIVERQDDNVMCDKYSVSFDVLSGSITDSFGDVTSAGDFIFLGLEDLYMVVE